jgi:hypothetical protein
MLTHLHHILPTFQFGSDVSPVLQYTFAGALGAATGVILYIIIVELIRFMKD